LEELNYLVAKIGGMTEEDRNIFGAALQAKWFCSSIDEMIPLAENLDNFVLHIFRDAESYGEFLLTMQQDDPCGSYARLENSQYTDDKEFAKYIKRLAGCADPIEYGKAVANEQGGVFTDYGYLRPLNEAEVIYKREREASIERPSVAAKLTLTETLQVNLQKSREQFGDYTQPQTKNRDNGDIDL